MPSAWARPGADRRIASWLGAGLLAIYLLIAGGHHYSIDGIVVFQTAKALLFRHTLVLDPPVRWGTDIAVGHWGVGMSLAYIPVLLAWWPLAAVFPTLTGVPYDPRAIANPELYANPAYLLSCWLNPLATAATAALVFALGRLVGLSRSWAVAAALAYGLGSPAFAYARYDFSQPLGALALSACLVGLLRASGLRPGRTSTAPAAGRAWPTSLALRDLGLAGGALGFGILVRVEFLVLVPWLVAWEAAQTRGRPLGARGVRLLTFAAPVTAAFFLHRAIEAVKYPGGGRFASGAAFVGQVEEWFRFSPPAVGEALAGLLVSPGRGLLLFFPLAWLAVLGLAGPALRNRSARFLLAGVVVLLVALYSAFRVWWAGISWGPRYLVPTLPILAVAAAAWAASAKGWLGHGPRRRAFAVLAALGFLIAWSGILVDPNVYYGWLGQRNATSSDEGASQFKIVASPPANAWGLAAQPSPDLLWIRLLTAPSSTPAADLARLVSAGSGGSLARYGKPAAALAGAALLGFVAAAARCVARELRGGEAAPCPWPSSWSDAGRGRRKTGAS